MLLEAVKVLEFADVSLRYQMVRTVGNVSGGVVG